MSTFDDSPTVLHPPRHGGDHPMIGRRGGALAALLIVASVAAAACTATEPYKVEGCTRGDLAAQSVARVWDEQLLALIRQVVPAPTVHARNLFHTSAAMWDAWAAYDPVADGYLVDEKHGADDVQAAREAAISYAAYRVLLHRYSIAAGLEATFSELASTMEDLCYRIDYTSEDGNSPAAL